MSKATKRKHVVREVLDEFVLPTNNQEIVRIVCGRGNNLHEVETTSGVKFLVSMPTKFRKNIWIKRGDFVMIEPIEEGEKVKAEITHILYKEQIKNIKQEGLWPKEFDREAQTNKNCSRVKNCNDESESGDDSDSDLFVNTNRPENYLSEDSSDQTDAEVDDDDDGNEKRENIL